MQYSPKPPRLHVLLFLCMINEYVHQGLLNLTRLYVHIRHERIHQRVGVEKINLRPVEIHTITQHEQLDAFVSHATLQIVNA